MAAFEEAVVVAVVAEASVTEEALGAVAEVVVGLVTVAAEVHNHKFLFKVKFN